MASNYKLTITVDRTKLPELISDLNKLMGVSPAAPVAPLGKLILADHFESVKAVLPPGDPAQDAVWVSGNNTPQGRTEMVLDDGERVLECSLDNDIEQAGARAFAGPRWDLFTELLDRVALITWWTKIMQPIVVPPESWMSLGLQGKDPDPAVKQALWATNVERELHPWLQASGVHSGTSTETLPVGKWFRSTLLLYCRGDNSGYICYSSGEQRIETGAVKTIASDGKLGLAFVLYCGFNTAGRIAVRYKQLEVRQL